MSFEPTAATLPASAYPLLIKQPPHSARATAGDQEIVYRDRYRGTYRQRFDRIGRLANAPSRRPSMSACRRRRFCTP